MREIGALEAAGTLGELLDLVEQGEEVVITRGGRVVARLVPGVAIRDRAAAEAAAERMLARSKGVTLGPNLTLRDLIDEGRR
ncbi:MAG: type II toxin-antitoxin system Phd/YefM family antitoxin [Paracraurococcus sp.]|jgi:prevent-host-death family protein